MIPRKAIGPLARFAIIDSSTPLWGIHNEDSVTRTNALVRKFEFAIGTTGMATGLLIIT